METIEVILLSAHRVYEHIQYKVKIMYIIYRCCKGTYTVTDAHTHMYMYMSMNKYLQLVPPQFHQRYNIHLNFMLITLEFSL